MFKEKHTECEMFHVAEITYVSVFQFETCSLRFKSLTILFKYSMYSLLYRAEDILYL